MARQRRDLRANAAICAPPPGDVQPPQTAGSEKNW
jgi:hypothetical protein